MIHISTTTQEEVWEHWRKVEGWDSPTFRSDIRDPLPTDLEWGLWKVEENDIPRLHIISSSDWNDITRGTFRVDCVNVNNARTSKNTNTRRIATDILTKCGHLTLSGHLDYTLIAVTDRPPESSTPKITIIEGNRRAVAFTKMNEPFSLYLGHSPNIRNYKWARYTYGEEPK